MHVFLGSVSVRCGVVFVVLVRRFGSAVAIGSVSVCIGFGFGAPFCIVEAAMLIHNGTESGMAKAVHGALHCLESAGFFYKLQNSLQARGVSPTKQGWLWHQQR